MDKMDTDRNTEKSAEKKNCLPGERARGSALSLFLTGFWSAPHRHTHRSKPEGQRRLSEVPTPPGDFCRSERRLNLCKNAHKINRSYSFQMRSRNRNYKDVPIMKSLLAFLNG
jgi:hypothetical protein